jgi:hypothetical protein
MRTLFSYLHRRPRLRRARPGQALVELSLLVVFVMLLLAAAVDIGLAFKTHQMLTNATAEASSYLAQQPTKPCATACSDAALIANADNAARDHFRKEIGTNFNSNGVARLLDLDNNGQDDTVQNLNLQADENGNVTAAGWGWVRIDAADSEQIRDPANPNSYNIRSFDPTVTDAACRERKRRWLGGQCFIVVRSQIRYKPFFALSPFMGGANGFLIRAYAIKPLVGGVE